MVKKNRRKKKKKIETSKVAIFFIFLNCSIIEIYSMVAMWYFADLSPLYSLIGAVLGESIAYISYCAKAKKENVKGGITYEMAMMNPQFDNDTMVNQ